MRTIGSFWNKAVFRRAGAALALALLGGWSASVHADEVQVVKSGKYYGEIRSYRIGDDYYLGAKEAARIYGGQIYWYAVRGTVRMSLRGRQIKFQVDSVSADVEGREVDMKKPMLVRASQAFIPVDFFTSKAFSDVSGVDTKFDGKTRLLLVDQRSNVGPLRWFTYDDHTRVVLELTEDLTYHTSKRGRFGFEVSIPHGTIDWSERTVIDDGAVDFLHFHQDAKQARLTLKLLEDSDGLRLREFQNPRRIVIDVAHASATAGRARAERVSVEAPEVPAETERESKPAATAAKTPTTAAATTPAVEGTYRIAIDAGHGGRDGGAVGRRGTLEKAINLRAAHELADLLKQEGIFEVKLIRDDDSFVKLGERASLANKYGADLFISIHCNAHSSLAESGYEIYFLSERASDPEAERLAEFENSVLALEGDEEIEGGAASVLYALAKNEFINDAAELAGLMTRSLSKRVDLPDRGVKQAAFYVLRGANAPAVLVEMGFLSNSRDETKLESSKYRRKIVEGLYAGIVEFSRRKGLRKGTAR